MEICGEFCRNGLAKEQEYKKIMPDGQNGLEKDSVITEHQISWVFQLAEYFAQGSPLHQKTVGTHSCILAVEGEILCRMEDIGRHNALDKVLGYALRQEVALNHAMVYTSGRVPVDMVTKVIRAGVPVLVSKAVPTLQSVAMARRYGLTLITSARPDMVKKW